MQLHRFISSQWRLLLLPLLGLAAAFLLRQTLLAPVPVHRTGLAPRHLTAEIYGNGTLEARVLVPVSARLTARILAVHADQGDEVRAGQLLAELDASGIAEQVRLAEAQTRAAGAIVRAEMAGLGKARANLGLAERNVQRYRDLASAGLVAAATAEQFETAWQVALEEMARGEAALAAAREQEQAAAAALAAARVQLADTRILAPLDGMIISRGQEAGAMAAPGLAIFRIVDPASVWVRAHVDEALLAGVRAGQPATIILRSAPGQRFAGQVTRVERESDRQTEELAVDVVFAEPRTDTRIGEQAEVYIETSRVLEAPSLPVAALARRGEALGVWVARQDRLAFREVTTGIEDRTGFVEIVSGLAAGETVALAAAGQRGALQEGTRVRVLP
ncbi:MAG: efflux RND transporter periplasmic adaptor subunit [Thermodesulfobacteriota bacterium]